MTNKPYTQLPLQISSQPDMNLTPDSLILWAESPEEARNFLKCTYESDFMHKINKIFVAKRSPRSRTNRYIGGEYYITSNDEAVDVYENVIIAPFSIINLVQWCTCDIMLSKGSIPYVAVEDTTHIVRMNLYQRIPRLVRAAMLGIPSIVLQGTRGLDFSLRGDRWALYRYLQVFNAISHIYPDSPSLPIWYEPNPKEELQAQNSMLEYINAILSENNEMVKKYRSQTLSKIRSFLKDGVDGDIPPDIPSLEHRGPEVIVHIGAKPNRNSWHTKGSGQMDPYVGLIAAAKYIYCYDKSGKQVKPLIIEFTYLPLDFWFFKDGANAKALYKRLPFEFADEVRFLG